MTVDEYNQQSNEHYENHDPQDLSRIVPVSRVINSTEIRRRIQELQSKKSLRGSLPIDNIDDQDWVAENPYIKGYDLSLRHKATRILSSADRKFEDTSLGGNYVCNPRPGFTPYADVPRRGLLAQRNDLSPTAPAHTLGMGDVYSRVIDDNYQVLDLRFGKPEYNSLTGFFSSYYSGRDALLANTGSYSKFLYGAGKVAGTVSLFGLLGPLLATGVLVGSYIGGALANIVFTNPHRFWYIRPTMHLYWRTVHNMVNQILSYKTIATGNQKHPITGETNIHGNDPDLTRDLQSLAPHIFDEDGSVNVRRVINRAERLNQHVRKEIKKAMETSESFESLRAAIDSKLRNLSEADAPYISEKEMSEHYLKINGRGSEEKPETLNSLLYGTIQDRHGETKEIGIMDPGTGFDADEAAKKMQLAGADDSVAEKIKGKLSKFWEYFNAELSDGSSFASFRVDHTGPVSESFGNSSMKNDLGMKFNEMSAKSRAAYFSMAGGNLLPGMDEIVGAAQSFLTGALEGIKLDGLLGLAGSAYADIPEIWENANFSGPSMDYQFRLVSPSAHPLSQLQFIYIPLAMIICGAIPHAAGRAAYTAPFFVEAYDRGKAITRHGLISRLQITRGVSNLGFTKSKDMLAVDVQFSIKDLAAQNYMPIETGLGLNPRNTIHGHDTTYSDYISVLGAATLGQNVYIGQKLRVRMRQWKWQVNQYTSVDHWAGFFRELPGIRALDIFWPDSGRGG